MAYLIEPYENDTGFFIKSFLADDQFNSNGWKIDGSALARDHESFIGQKFVLLANDDKSDYLHPEFEVQEQFASGPIFKTGFDRAAGKAWFEAKIEDPIAIELIKSGKIKYISPGLTATSWIEHDDGRKTITAFKGEHVAGVMRPAYGKYKAQIKGQCSGRYGECKQHLVHVQACDGCKNAMVASGALGAITSDNHKLATSHSEMAGQPDNSNSNEQLAQLTAQVKDLTDKVSHYESQKTTDQQTIAGLKAALETASKKPLIERIIAARVELGEVKEESKASEEEMLLKQSVDSLTYIAGMAEASVKKAKAVQDNVATLPPQYRKHFSAAEESNADEKAGDKIMLRMRRGD